MKYDIYVISRLGILGKVYKILQKFIILRMILGKQYHLYHNYYITLLLQVLTAKSMSVVGFLLLLIILSQATRYLDIIL
jgi:hypothetical protein